MTGRPRIGLDVQDGVGWLTMRNPAKLNALTGQMVDGDLPEVCRAVEDDPDVRAVVLTGEGRGFCVGADRDDHLARLGRGGEGTLGRPLGGFVLHVARLGKPVVAAVNGTTAGGGLGLAFVCDVRVGSTAATFVAAYPQAGLVPDGGLTYLLPRLAGPSAAARFLLGGQPLDAAGAAAAGLLDEVVEPDALAERAQAVALSLAAAAPEVTSATKRLLTAGPLAALEAHIDRESEQQWAFLARRGGADA